MTTYLDANADGLALLLIVALAGTAVLLVLILLRLVIRGVDSYTERVVRGRAAQAREYAARDAAWRERVRNAALLVQSHGWQGPDGRRQRNEP